ncbi:TIGR02680 family protein [Streptomyces sp. DvalAA-14]|uniref:TIGR02680 family protein n=1 Tax=unclassified Streptomyces TaxID=2593676 RepID=UPI00081B8E25|nr:MULTISPECIES: TIGR02680 family protein [unclassified Streptomyces]MYS22500.1 TIGR02680 family protein [Streptomyces sp. SID4948]SCE17315.1 TIGR02680 family protein [Streptomyces sp. DvalAA-14]
MIAETTTAIPLQRATAPATTRFRLHRAGIRNVWQYDEQEFAFGDGRLLLRGKNGAGKSKALEMLLPYLLDGDSRALDATGTGRTTLVWLMLDGFEQTNRLGYLWVEFRRPSEDEGGHQYLTLGAAIRASKSTNRAVPAFFVTPLRVGEDLQLVEAGRPLSVDKLKDRIGEANVSERAVDHRARVARELFGITDVTRFRNVTQLLHRLRRPTVGDRIESGGLALLLSETLPGLDDEVVDKVARNLHDLDAVRSELGRLEKTDRALRDFLVDYHHYLTGVLRRASVGVGDELGRLTEGRRKAGDAAKEVSRWRKAEGEAVERHTAVSETLESARAELNALHVSDSYRGVQELSERRTTVQALHKAAVSAHSALLTAHEAEQGAAGRLSGDLGQLAERLAGLAAEHGDLRSEAEKVGLPTAHLGDAVIAQQTELAGPCDIEVPDPDDVPQTVRHHHVVSVDTAATAQALESWARQLEAGQSVAKNRSRAVAEVQRLSGLARKALTEAVGADTERERLELDLEEAVVLLETARARVVEESTSYGASVSDWVKRVTAILAPGGPDLAPVLAVAALEPGLDAPLAERTLPADVDAEAAQAAHLVLNPHEQDLSAMRDHVALSVRELQTAFAELQRQRQEWEGRTDPEPPAPSSRSAARSAGTGAPFYQLVDFADGLSDTQRAHLEAALQASGLLDAWVSADGSVLDPRTLDTLLDPGSAAPEGPTLAAALRPVERAGAVVSTERVHHVLSSIALAPGTDTDSPSTVYVDGSWRLGALTGRSSKPTAEFVGAAVRAETRRRKLGELEEQLADVGGRLTDERAKLVDLDIRRDGLSAALRRFPSSRLLSHAWAESTGKESSVRELTGKASSAARAAVDARTAAVAARHVAEAAATAHDLPTDSETLAGIAASLTAVHTGLVRLAKAVHRSRSALDNGGSTRDAYERAHQGRLGSEGNYRSRLDELRPARQQLATLVESIGSGEEEILAREDAVKELIEASAGELPHARSEMDSAREARVRAEEAEKHLREELTLQESAVVSAGSTLRRAVDRPEVLRGAGLDRAALPDRTADAPADDVRSRIRLLRELSEAVDSRLDRSAGDVSDNTLMKRHTTLRDALAGGYDAQLVEDNGIKVCRLLDDHGSHDVAMVGERIAAQATEARGRLTERESEVFQRFLTGELGDHLSTQVIAAANLVTALNDTLRTVRTSHGLGVELQWKLNEDVDADVRAAVELLKSPSGLRTREQTEQLREVLQRQIEDARRADPSAGYAAHLRTALDYRDWFRFHTFVVEDAHPGRRRRLTGRTGLSQGEQRVLSYLILFAAAASHFTTLGESAPHAPRLILLDDAFAKVDEPTHGRLGHILVDLDLDFVLTSERLMGNWAEVPSLHIYECLRDPHVRGVATLHYTWNGRNRRLVSV